MIKEFEKDKINEVMHIWLDTNITAHSFITEQYWTDNYNVVKEQYLPISKTFVYLDDSSVKAFISVINKSFIGALFVTQEYQGQGIGLKLINHCKSLYPKLELAVYVDNSSAVDFYKRCGFEIQMEQTNKDSGFREYTMFWNRID